MWSCECTRCLIPCYWHFPWPSTAILLTNHVSCFFCRVRVVIQAFHKNCVMPWLGKHCTCPVCRFELNTNGNTGSQQERSDRRQHEQVVQTRRLTREQDILAMCKRMQAMEEEYQQNRARASQHQVTTTPSRIHSKRERDRSGAQSRSASKASGQKSGGRISPLSKCSAAGYSKRHRPDAQINGMSSSGPFVLGGSGGSSKSSGGFEDVGLCSLSSLGAQPSHQPPPSSSSASLDTAGLLCARAADMPVAQLREHLCNIGLQKQAKSALEKHDFVRMLASSGTVVELLKLPVAELKRRLTYMGCDFSTVFDKRGLAELLAQMVYSYCQLF